MFKIGVITDEISQDFERAVQVASEYGLQTVEIRSTWEKPPHALQPADIARIKAILEPTGMTVSCIASPFYKCKLDDEAAIKEHHEILRRCIDLGHQLGTKLVRGFTFWDTGRTDDVWDIILANFQVPADIVDEMDAILAIENEAACSVGTGKQLDRMLTEINHPRIRAVWDPGNEVFAQGGERPYPDAYERVKSHMVHFHLKDAIYDEEKGKTRCVAVGEGIIDYPGQLRALLASDYQGSVSLETHWRPEHLTDEQINRPGGAAFSAKGEYASRVCIESILRMVREAAG